MILSPPPAPEPSMNTPKGGLLVDHVSPEAVIARYRNVFLWAWRGTATAATCARLQRAVVEIASSHPEGSGAITLIVPGITIPSDDVRKRIVQLRREASAHAMRGGAILHEGDPLRRSIVRGVVTGLGLLTRDIYPQAVFGQANEAIGWLGERVGPSLPPLRDLTAALDELKALAARRSLQG